VSIVDRLKDYFLTHFSKPVGDRPIFRSIQQTPPRTIVEIGLGTGERTGKVIRFAQQCRPADRIEYTAVDLFELSPAGRPALSLKAAHQKLTPTGARIRLVPGDPYTALARMANTLTGTDLLLITAEHDAAAMARAWFYVPRMLTRSSVVLVETTDKTGRQFVALSATEVASRIQPQRRRAA
jgi:hypothetical protein